MAPISQDELVLIRHAPADHGGRLCGRTDVDALVPNVADLAALRARLTGIETVTSPAKRCRQTAQALFDLPDLPQDPRLWEQDFGDHEGVKFADLPDLGPMTTPELARHTAAQGESFLDMFARVSPALEELMDRVRNGQGPIVVIAHAGTARAGIGLALGQPELALGFEIAPLSCTRLRCHAAGVSVIATNERATL